MKKNTKWILLIILIISIITTIILFINYVNNKDINNNSEISNIYNKNWFRKTVTLYTEENEFVYESDNIIDDRYIIFDKDFVYYCNITENDCKKYNYTYNKKNKTIFINAEDKFIKKGTYKITLEEENFKLTIEEQGFISIHKFEN